MCRTVSLFVLLLSAVLTAQNGKHNAKLAPWQLLFARICVSHYILHLYTGQSCLSSNRRALPKFRDYHSTDFTASIIQHRNQAIIPSYRFNCNGNITEWGVDVNRPILETNMGTLSISKSGGRHQQ